MGGEKFLLKIGTGARSTDHRDMIRGNWGELSMFKDVLDAVKLVGAAIGGARAAPTAGAGEIRDAVRDDCGCAGQLHRCADRSEAIDGDLRQADGQSSRSRDA